MKHKADYEISHSQLAFALNEISLNLLKREIVLKDKDAIVSRFEFDGVPYGTTKEAHAEIETIKGKSTKKWFHVSIYRLESGRYELTIYVL